MSTIPKDDNREAVQAFGLPQVGQTQIILAGTLSPPLSVGHYRFHSTVDVNLAVGAVPTVADLLLQAGVDEYFYIQRGGIVGVFGGDVSITQMP